MHTELLIFTTSKMRSLKNVIFFSGHKLTAHLRLEKTLFFFNRFTGADCRNELHIFFRIKIRLTPRSPTQTNGMTENMNECTGIGIQIPGVRDRNDNGLSSHCSN